MARVATSGWVSGSVAPARLRLYHVLFMLFSALAAAAIAAPSILTQPILYSAQAVVQFDPRIFPGLVESGATSGTLKDMQAQLGEVLKDKYEGLGSRRRGLDYRIVEANSASVRVEVTAFTPDVAESIRLTNEAAEKLGRRIYAAPGTVLLRNLLGQQLQAALDGAPIRSPDDEYLRYIIQTDALYGGVKPARGSDGLTDLGAEQRRAVTLALEVQEELTRHDLLVAERIIATGKPTKTVTVADARATKNNALKALPALTGTERYLYKTYKAAWNNPRQPGPVFLAAAATGAVTLPTYNVLKLLLAVLVGLLGGLFTVMLDRAVGLATKLQELWSYRDLIRNMVMRDLKARYKSSILGYVWSLLNPLMMMLIFWFVFSVLLKNEIPMFPVFLIVALLPWNFAVTAVSGGMRSILDNAQLVKKVYFPREILPIAVVLANLVNYLLALPVMFLVMAGVQWTQLHHLQFSWTFAFMPVILAIQIIFLVGVTLLLSTLAVFFRDTTHIVDILIQLWIFLTPIFFSLESVTRGNETAAKAVRWLNPMASIVDFYRDVLYGQASSAIPHPGLPALDGVFRTLLTALVVLAVGAYVFHRHSAHFGEEL
jgi:lipopolysaccharide transport system permease protein